MDAMLFSGRSIWTMIHGIALGGGALMGLAAALFSLRAMSRSGDSAGALQSQSNYLAALAVFIAILICTALANRPRRQVAPRASLKV